MRRLLVSCVLGFCACATSAAEWFTIMGDPADARADTIQIDPVARKVDGPVRVMALRVSRSMPRTSGGGVVFRSYEGTVEFDCERRSARFLRSQFYDQPLWKQAGPVVDFPASDVRPMAFRDFEPNPRDRVIRAACQGHAVAGVPGAAPGRTRGSSAPN